jgi:sugar/nucleoside kinase (ribokinase family)
MTGEDIRLEDALKLKGDGRLVYIDLHMIAYRVLENGHRRPAPSEDWKTWIAAGDVLQCNAHEFDALSGTSRPLRERLEELFLCAAPVAFVLTRGEDGADIYTSPDDYLHIAAIPPVKTVDPTGCGDAFGSTFAWGLAQGDSHEAAAQRAAFAASFVATLPGSVGIEKLRGHLAGVGT